MAEHDAAWDKFLDYIASARETMADQWAPVALICLQAKVGEDGATDLMPWNDAGIIWPKDFPVSQRGPLLRRMAKPYDDGTVLR